MDETQNVSESLHDDRRAWQRYVLENKPVIALRSGDRHFEGRIVDISPSGLLIEVDDPAAVGQDVVLEHQSVGALAAKRVRVTETAIALQLEMTERTLHHVLQCICIMITPPGAEKADISDI